MDLNGHEKYYINVWSSTIMFSILHFGFLLGIKCPKLKLKG